MTMEADANTPSLEPSSVQLMKPTQALTTLFEIGRDIDETKDELRYGAASLTDGEPRQGFRVGGLSLMIRFEDSSELSEMFPLHRLPNAPDWFCGIANLHGRLIPVFDLAGYIGVEASQAARHLLLVLSHGSDAAGVVIDGIPERLRLSGDDYTDVDTAPERLALHLRGASFIGERLWFDLDTHSLLGAIEQSLGAPQ